MEFEDEDDGFMDQFVSGIYNYCDRWCERCAFTEKCYLYHEEQSFMEREVLAGNDPNSMESAIRSIEDSFGKAMQMLAQMAEERGVDLNELPPAEPRGNYREHPLFIQAMDWGKRLEALVDRMHSELEDVAVKVGLQFAREHADCQEESDLALAGREADQTIARFKDAFELLARYRFLVPAKVGRATSALVEKERDLRDANGTARLLQICLERIISSLWIAGEFHRPWLEGSLSVAAGAEALRRALDSALPGHRTFVRPGLDEVEA